MQKIKDLIAEGDLETAIGQLLQAPPTGIDPDELLLLQARLADLKRAETAGIIDDDDKRIETNKIRYDLLNLLSPTKGGRRGRLASLPKYVLPVGFATMAGLALLVWRIARPDPVYLPDPTHKVVEPPPQKRRAVLNLVSDDKALVMGSRNTVLWRMADGEKALPLNFSSVNTPDELVASVVMQIGEPKFMLRFNDTGFGFSLYLEMGDSTDAFFHQKGYYFQIAEHDFDGDNNPEIIVAYGDHLIDLHINIFKYHAPQSAAAIERPQNYELVARLQGQENSVLEGNKIILPFGSQGLFEEYAWVDGKFVQTN
jgi:Effector-associated domain 11